MSENIAYLLVTASTILFACQFLFQKKYGESEGEGLRASVTLALLSSIVRIILVVVLYGVSGYSFTLYGFVCSFFAAVSYCCVILFSAGALKYANMAKYSVYMMLGGMVLPFAAGTAFFSEPLTFGKFAGLLLVAAATCFSNLKAGTKTRGAVKYYIGVFICNGMNGVISKFNQSSPDGLSASSLTLLTAAWSVVICAVYLVVSTARSEKKPLFSSARTAIPQAALYGAACGIGNLLLLISLEKLPASVQYPLVTGGTIVFSTIISVIRREKLNAAMAISVVLAMISAVAVVL